MFLWGFFLKSLWMILFEALFIFTTLIFSQDILSVVVLVAQSSRTLWYPVDCSPPGSSVNGIVQARILKWIAIPFSRWSSRSKDQTRGSSIAGRFFTVWATGKILRFSPKIYLGLNKIKLFLVSLYINVLSLKNTYICLMLVFLQNVLIEVISVR